MRMHQRTTYPPRASTPIPTTPAPARLITPGSGGRAGPVRALLDLRDMSVNNLLKVKRAVSAAPEAPERALDMADIRYVDL